MVAAFNVAGKSSSSFWTRLQLVWLLMNKSVIRKSRASNLFINITSCVWLMVWITSMYRFMLCHISLIHNSVVFRRSPPSTTVRWAGFRTLTYQPLKTWSKPLREISVLIATKNDWREAVNHFRTGLICGHFSPEIITIDLKEGPLTHIWST